MPGYHLGGLQVAFQAIEAFRRNLACELGPHGVRVVTLQTAGVVDSIPEDMDGREAIVEATERRTMLNRAATPSRWPAFVDPSAAGSGGQDPTGLGHAGR